MTRFIFIVLLYCLMACQEQEFSSRSPSQDQDFTPTAPESSDSTFFDCNDNHGIIADVFSMDDQLNSVNQIPQDNPTITVCMNNFDIAQKVRRRISRITGAIRMVRNSSQNKIEVQSPGEYEFELLADDGTVLYINDQIVIDRDGLHGANSKMDRLP